MVPMKEMPEETNTMEFILSVCIIKSLQILKLLQTSLVPKRERKKKRVKKLTAYFKAQLIIL